MSQVLSLALILLLKVLRLEKLDLFESYFLTEIFIALGEVLVRILEVIIHCSLSL